MHAEAIPQCNGASDMVRMPVRDEYALDATALHSCLYNSIKVGNVVCRWINYRYAFDSFAKNDGLCAWDRHDRGIRGNDDCVWLLHNQELQLWWSMILSYAQALPRCWQRLLEERHEFCHFP